MFSKADCGEHFSATQSGDLGIGSVFDDLYIDNVFEKEKTVIGGTLNDKANGALCSNEDSYMKDDSDMYGCENVVPGTAEVASSSYVFIYGASDVLKGL